MVLAHGSILEAPAFAVVIDKLGRFAGEEQGFLKVLLAHVNDQLGDTRKGRHIFLDTTNISILVFNLLNKSTQTIFSLCAPRVAMQDVIFFCVIK